MDGRQRVSTAALDPSSKERDQYRGLSIDIESFIVEDGLDPLAFVSTPQFTGAIAFTVNAFRSRSFLVGYDPRAENPYHGAVWEAENSGSRFTRGTKKSLAEGGGVVRSNSRRRNSVVLLIARTARIPIMSAGIIGLSRVFTGSRSYA